MCHVLIIEDEALVAMNIELLLAAEGATSFSFAATEGEAVSAAIGCPPGLITSDVRLLAGRGPAAVEKIIAALGPIPVIFITATPHDLAADDPSAMVLAKPVTAGVLAEAYRHFIGGDGVARAGPGRSDAAPEMISGPGGCTAA